ncbi:MAG TPA: N-methyl-L-tryptophan oxidase, partial [Xanthobacteraceae bacterium]|nr:N-methyl-L-tryptophan oxidase [Xanthobacteraceae bacterium]
MAEYDVVVVGLGVMGSAALHRLARRGKRVLGIEQFLPGHDRGSSHGETRLIRLAYFEDASYVPLLREAYGLWRELEEESDRSLMTITGILEIGTPDGELVSGTLASSRLHSLPHDVMTADETMKRFPALVVPSGYTGVFQPDGGYLAAESTVQAQIDLALAAGVDIKADTHVDSIVPQGTGVRLKTSAGEIDAGAAVVTAGPWLNKLLPSLAAPLSVTRQVLGWLSPAQPDQFTANKFPVFLFESELGLHYGFPVHGHSGLKISKHHHLREPVDPDT